MRSSTKKCVWLWAVATAASMVMIGAATGGVAGAAPAGAITTGVASGTETTVFSILPPPGASCSGAGTSGFRWHGYITNVADSSTLTFGGGGPNAVVGSYVSALYDGGGNPVINKNPAAAPVGLITGIPTYSLGTTTTPLSNGVYKIGYACTLAGAVEGGHYWESPITISGISGANFNWTFGVVPGAPTGSTAVGGGGVITGSIAAVTATPAVSGYTVTATATGGLPDASSPRVLNVPAAGAYSMPILEGTTYSVTISATNSVGTGASVTIGLVVSTENPLLVLATASSGVGSFGVAWTTLGGRPGWTLLGFTIDVFPSVPGSPFSVPAGVNTLTVTAPVGAYSIHVQAVLAAPGWSIGSTTTAFSSGTSVLVQDLQVVRPQGALVLTQRCGVHGSAPAYSDSVVGTFPALAATPGADPVGLDAPAAVGTAPRRDSLPNDPNLGLGPTDTLFPQYPYPVDGNGDYTVTYPTNCGINLGSGALITSGPRAGQYFKATGRIAQLTVVNTRDPDSGWTLNGRMSQFQSTTDNTDTFSGNLLGWDPEVTWDSNANLDGYDMVVTPGGVRQPSSTASLTGLGDASNSTNTTLASSLAQSLPGASLGQAVMDARLRLLIPVTADNGTYRGVLTFTTI
jgi:hypothetical protein